MSQTETENGQIVVPVRIVEPIPARGRMEVLQSKLGQLKVKRQTPTLLLPERFTRVHARLFNNSPNEDLIVGSNESVAGFTGTRIPAQKDLEIRGPNPVYATTDPAPVAIASISDRGLVGTISRKTVLVTNPAVGTDWTITVPAGEFWDLESFTATLVTSAVVGNRAPRLEISDGVNRVAEIQPSTVQAASLTVRWGMSPGGPTGSNSNGAGIAGWGGPSPFLLSPGFVISVATVNLDPTAVTGDQWSQLAFDVFFVSPATAPAAADGIVVSLLDEYLVPWESKGSLDKRKKGRP